MSGNIKYIRPFSVPDSKIIQHLYDINAGSTFGELALIRNMVRNFTVICKGNFFFKLTFFIENVFTQRLNQNDLPKREYWYNIVHVHYEILIIYWYMYIQATRNFLVWARVSLTRYWERITKIPGTNGWISFRSQSTLKRCQKIKSDRWRICQKSGNIPIIGWAQWLAYQFHFSLLYSALT